MRIYFLILVLGVLGIENSQARDTKAEKLKTCNVQLAYVKLKLKLKPKRVRLPKGFFVNNNKLDTALKMLVGVVDFGQTTMFEMEAGDPRLKAIDKKLGANGALSGKSIYKAAERVGGWKTNLDRLGISFNQYNKIWSRERIIELIHYLAENQITLNLSHLRDLYPQGIPGSEKIFGRVVNPEVLRQYVQEYFKDWWEAIEEAGYSRLNYQKRVGDFWRIKKNISYALKDLNGKVDLHPKAFTHLSPEDPHILALSQKLGIRVNPDAIYHGAVREYGSWPEALKALRIKLEPLIVRWSKEIIIAELRQLDKDGELSSRPGAIDPNLNRAIYVYFGTWNAAIKAAKLDFNKYRKNSKEFWRPDDILKILVRIYQDKKTLNFGVISKMDEEELFKYAKGILPYPAAGDGMCQAMIRLFGSYDDAIEKAGYDPQDFHSRPKYEKLNWDQAYHIKLLQKIQSYGYPPVYGFLYHPEVFAVIKDRLKKDLRQNFSGSRIYKESFNLFGSHRKALEAAGIKFEIYSSPKARGLLVRSILETVTKRKFPIPDYIYFLERFGYTATPQSFIANSKGIGHALAVEYGINVSGRKLLWLAKYRYGGLKEAIQQLGLKRKTLKENKILTANAYNIPVFLRALSETGIKWQDREVLSSQLKKAKKYLEFYFGPVDIESVYQQIPKYLSGELERPTRESLMATGQEAFQKRQTVFANLNEYRERDETATGDKLVYTTLVSITAPTKETSLEAEEIDLYQNLGKSVLNLKNREQDIIQGILAYLENHDDLEDMADVTNALNTRFKVHKVTEAQVRAAYEKLAEQFAGAQDEDGDE